MTALNSETSAPNLQPPRAIDTMRELSLPWDMRGTLGAFRRAEPAVENTPPVTVIPGLWASDSHMVVLHRYLTRAGYDPKGWGLGLNTAGQGLIDDLDALSPQWEVDRSQPHNGEGEVPYLCDQMVERVKARAELEQRAIALVGWSLGGFIAREVARDLPDHVSCVVTLGSPVIGGPKYTRAKRSFRARGYDFDWIERETLRRHSRPISQPVTAVFSKRDGIVGWTAAQDRFSPNVTHHEVGCSHVGLGFHGPTLEIVKDALDEVYT